MKVIDTDLPGCMVHRAAGVRRRARLLLRIVEQAALGANTACDLDFVQSNVSMSARGVLRGLHYQWPQPQGKLVSVLEGEV